MLQNIIEKIKNYKRKEIEDGSLPRAAVLIPILQKDQELQLLFTKRTQKVDIHKGQISFPGGRFEKSDGGLDTTVLRETKEEVGVPKESINLISCIDDMMTATGFLITPFVGILNFKGKYSLDNYEIERTIEVPLEFIRNERNWEKEKYIHEGKPYIGDFLIYENEKIWGITAKILKNFLDILTYQSTS